MKMKALMLLAAIAVVSGCATLSNTMAVRSAEKAVELINSQDTGALARHSGKPFIFESEALFRPVDTQAVWGNLTDNGFTLVDPVVVEVSRVDESSYAVFSNADEMKIIFDKYVPESATLATVETDRGTFYLLLAGGTQGYPSILGITGF